MVKQTQRSRNVSAKPDKQKSMTAYVPFSRKWTSYGQALEEGGSKMAIAV
jgi:hypothetical protein